MKYKFDEVEKIPVGTRDYRPRTEYVASHYNSRGEHTYTTLCCFLKGYNEGDIMEYNSGDYAVIHFEHEPGLRDAPEDVQHGIASIPEWVTKNIYEPWLEQKRGERNGIIFR
jgi:hypothetical protein